MPEPVAVVGASGFQGRHLLGVLAARGVPVRAVCRRRPEAPHDEHRSLDVLDASAGELAAALAGCRAVVNLVGIKMERERTFEEAHVEVVDRLVAACREAGIDRFVHVSALVHQDLHPYHGTKLEGERHVRASGLDWRIVRPAVVWGPGDDFVRNLDALVQSASLLPVPRTAAPVSPVWVGDVSEATARVLERDEGGSFDLAGPESKPLGHWVQVVADAQGLPVRRIAVPTSLMAGGALVMEATQRDPLVTKGQVRLLSGGLAGPPDGLRALGIEPRPLRGDGVREVLEATRKPAPVQLRWTRRWAPVRKTAPSSLVAIVVAVLGLHAWAFLAGGPGDSWSRFVAAAVVSAALAALVVRRGVGGFRWIDVPLGLAVTGVAYGAAWLVAGAPALQPSVEAFTAWPPHGVAVLAAALALGIAAEELLWRGVLLPQFTARMPVALALLASGVLQAAVHAPSGNWLLVAAAFAMGLVWGALFVATRRIGAAAVAHASFDALLFLVAPLA